MAPFTSSIDLPASATPFLATLERLSTLGWQFSPFRPEALAAHGLLRAFLTADHPNGRSAIATSAVTAEAASRDEQRVGRLFNRCAGRLIATIAGQHEDQGESQNQLWQRSPLSGVGWGLTAGDAKRQSRVAAGLAHSVLASWYGQSLGRVGPKEASPFPGYHQQLITFPSLSLTVDQDRRAEVIAAAGFVLWPEDPRRVLIGGFGGGADREAAKKAAEEAVVDKLAFLSDEQRLRRKPRFAPGRRYALEMLMHAAGEQQVTAWLAALESRKPQAAKELIGHTEDIAAPLGLDSFAVMKTTGANLLPLVYGRGFPLYEGMQAKATAQADKPLAALSFHPFV